MENLAALLSGNVDAATMTGPSGGTRAAAQGFRYVVHGPDLHIPFAAATLIRRRSVLNARTGDRKICPRHRGSDENIIFGQGPYLQSSRQAAAHHDRKLLDAAYDEEIKVMEQRLEFKNEAFQAIIDETGKVDARAEKIKPQDLVDRGFLDAMNKSGFFEKLWAK